MKQKKLFILAAAALLAACSNDDIALQEQTQQATEDQAVSFDAYTNRATTRAGGKGELTTTTLQGAANGFGVFGYYTNGELYNETAKPDFMYNQQVTYSGGQWTYSPLKYWPNEFGNNAASEEIDRLTFFAYAPYTNVTPSTGVVTGDATTGIVGMTRNTTSGNPLIKYYAELSPAECVDLCWGVANSAFNSSVDGTNNNVAANEPYIDVVKPKISDKIAFNFKHALAQLNVQIDADIDVLSHATSSLDGMTRIYVRSVTFEGFTTKGALDLNSEWADNATTPNWYDVSGNGKLSLDPITVFDGRRDGKEGVTTATAKNETPDDLNPQIVQSAAYTTTTTDGAYTSLTSTTPGVTNTAVNLFNSDSLTAPVLVIPTAEAMKVTIVYDVETADASLSGYLSDGATRGSTIENAITQEIKLAGDSDMELAAGKKYTVKLHLGMTSVKFDAEVSAWETGDKADVDLPINETAGVAWSTSTPGVSTVSAAGGDVQFIIANAPKGVIANVYKNSDVNNIISGLTATKDGDRIRVDYTTAANTTTKNRTAKIYVEVDGKTMCINVTQTAKIGLKVTNVEKDSEGVYSRAAGRYGFILGAETATSIEWASATITVKDEEGNTLTSGAGKDYVFNPSSKDLTILDAAKPVAGNSKKFTITVSAGNAPAETVTVKITVPSAS